MANRSIDSGKGGEESKGAEIIELALLSGELGVEDVGGRKNLLPGDYYLVKYKPAISDKKGFAEGERYNGKLSQELMEKFNANPNMLLNKYPGNKIIDEKHSKKVVIKDVDSISSDADDGPARGVASQRGDGVGAVGTENVDDDGGIEDESVIRVNKNSDNKWRGTLKRLNRTLKENKDSIVGE
ncbi:MAG: hypothetical protein HQK53_08125 [Oligoflexia bacterium]|nr:hypothetical protein [Oligoflexia bacterium]